jgi:hypothetical protein
MKLRRSYLAERPNSQLYNDIQAVQQDFSFQQAGQNESAYFPKDINKVDADCP